MKRLPNREGCLPILDGVAGRWGSRAGQRFLTEITTNNLLESTPNPTPAFTVLYPVRYHFKERYKKDPSMFIT